MFFKSPASLDPRAGVSRGRLVPRVAIVSIMAALGCNQSPQIETYEVAHSAAVQAPFDAKAERARLDHLFAAVLTQPEANRAWFFKLVAKDSVAGELRPKFDALLSSVKFAPAENDGDDKQPSPAWTLPAGWSNKPGTSARFATIAVPLKSGDVEIAVSQLPYDGQWDAFLMANIARWANQLQEPAPDAKRLDSLTRVVATSAGKATIVELVGQMAASTMPSGHPPIAAAEAPGAVAPEQRPASPSSAAEFKYKTPAGWRPGAMNAMRKASFEIGDDKARAEATVTSFPGQPGVGMGDVSSNLQRWASQVGLGDKDAKSLQALARQRQVGGSQGTFAELLGPPGEGAQGALVVLLPRDGMIWFFKLIGDRTVVESQKKQFDEFLDSVKFN